MVFKTLAGRARKSASQTHDFSRLLEGYEPPSFPTVVGDALGQLADPESDMATVAAVVERDPATSTRVLRLANSATFSPRRPIVSVHQAAMLMGRNQLEALLISVGARGVLPTPRVPGFDEHRFWTTASKRAAIASSIAERTDPSRRSENFTAALLQDMAIPVLALKTESYGELLQHWHNSDDEDLANLETAAFGWHHGLVAGWIGDQWQFPAELVQFIEGHHAASDNDHLLPARLVSPLRETSDRGVEEIIETGAARTELNADELRSLTDEANALAESLVGLMG